jgi:hypothetical protein
MSDIGLLEQRITAALARIAQSLDQPVAASVPDAVLEELESERLLNAQLSERVRVLKEKQDSMVGALQERVNSLVEQLDSLGVEYQRLKKSAIALRENNRVLREALEQDMQEQGSDAHLINKSMMAELDALRTHRLAESAEMDELIAELRPLVEGHSHA